MIEISEKQIDFITKKKDYHILFVNSPFCGTCKVARRMLLYIEETLQEEKFYEVNAIMAKDFMQHYQIQSVPCLLIFHNGHLVDRLYTFNSVPYLLKEIAPYLKS